MFFGNQVTCEYWDYVWLNEGFASYLEQVIADKVRAFERTNLIDIRIHKNLLRFCRTGAF